MQTRETLHQFRGSSHKVQVKQTQTNKQTDLLNHNRENNFNFKSLGSIPLCLINNYKV
jgi:hypothetical protein